MIKSFLNNFLPDDEYKRLRIVYFMAEASFFAVLICLILGFLRFLLNFKIDIEFLLLLGPLIMAYVFFRYLFSGLEYTNLISKADYVKKRKTALKRSVLVGLAFFVLNFIVKGIPENKADLGDIFILPLVFIIFYYIFEIISLKRSMKKNLSLDE